MANKDYNVKVEAPSAKEVEEFVGRASWGNKVEFILTVVGLAVGLGNVWRFPYLCYSNGGGAFLIPYFGSLILVGIPMFMLELSFGQFSSLGPIAGWSISPLFKGLGCAMVTINTFITLYYNIVLAWITYYFFASMTSKLPWQDCGNPWNTWNCCRFDSLSNLSANASDDVKHCKTPAEEYFFHKVLKISGGIGEQGTIVWELALCHLFVWLCIFLVLVKGIKSLGKVVYFSTIFPYVLLTVMLVRGVTLDGAYQGIIYYIKPDFARLSDGKTWSDAATQIFYSLSLCTGGMITLSSFNPFQNNVFRDSIMVPIINCLTSFYGGFAIFSVMGYMAKKKNLKLSQVVQQGPGLVFVVYPEALTTMPMAPLWSILFFLMMLTLGFSSQFSQVETTLSAFIDNFSTLRKSKIRLVLFRACGCLVLFISGLIMVTNGGFYILSLFDTYIGSIPLLFVGLMEFVAIQYIYGYSNFADDIEMMLGRKPCLFYRITWCFLSPIILLAVAIFLLVQHKVPVFYEKPLPMWGEGLGWLLVAIIISMLPMWFMFYFLRNGGWQLIKKLSRPTEDWGPLLEKYQTGKYARKEGAIKSGTHFEPELFVDECLKQTGVRNEAFTENDNLEKF